MAKGMNQQKADEETVSVYQVWGSVTRRDGRTQIVQCRSSPQKAEFCRATTCYAISTLGSDPLSVFRLPRFWVGRPIFRAHAARA